MKTSEYKTFSLEEVDKHIKERIARVKSLKSTWYGTVWWVIVDCIPLIPSRIEGMYYKIKWRLQQALRGYSDPDIWNLYHNSELRTAMLLKKLLKVVHGYPISDAISIMKLGYDPVEDSEDSSNGMSMELWKTIIEDMIYHFESRDLYEDYFYMKRGYINDKVDFDPVRYSRGWYAFVHYRTALWD